MLSLRPLLVVASSVLALVSCQTTPPAQPDRFPDADTNKDGLLNGTEINNYFVSGIFTERDTNHDGVITKAEWNPEMDAAEGKLFDARDPNKDGKVTLAEAEAYAIKAGTYSSVLKEADTNKDGSVSREEAKAYYASKEGPAR